MSLSCSESEAGQRHSRRDKQSSDLDKSDRAGEEATLKKQQTDKQPNELPRLELTTPTSHTERADFGDMDVG